MLETLRTLQEDVKEGCGPMGEEIVCQTKRRAFENYRQNIDLMRALHHAFGYTLYGNSSYWFGN
jgi:hypothetical protein